MKKYIALAFIAIINLSALSAAQTTKSDTISIQEQETISVIETAMQAATAGPASIKFLDEGTLELPKGYLFIPSKEAAALMINIGNTVGSDFIGMIMPAVEGNNSFIAIEFIKSGYIRNEDAKNWNVDDLLSTIKKNTEIANKNRIAKNIKPIDVIGWAEVPKYDNSRHHLVYSILLKDVGASTEEGTLVNYNAYSFGRSGFFIFNLVTLESQLSTDKLYAKKILADLHYNKGKSYEDFDEAKDEVAAYGLAALITGVAAKKLGFFALAAVFLAKAWKFAILICLLFIGKLKDVAVSLFKRCLRR